MCLSKALLSFFIWASSWGKPDFCMPTIKVQTSPGNKCSLTGIFIVRSLNSIIVVTCYMRNFNMPVSLSVAEQASFEPYLETL